MLQVNYCSYRVAKYACLNWHYSKKIPIGKLVKIGVWERNKFIGVLLYGDGLLGNKNIVFGIKKVEVAELVRIALCKHETEVSRLIKISIKLLKKVCPKIEVIFSFADTHENHHGGIYQASNFVYTGISKGGALYRHKTTKKIYHDRSVSNSGIRKIMGKYIHSIKSSECDFLRRSEKYRYILPLSNKYRDQILKMKKLYPKRIAEKAL